MAQTLEKRVRQLEQAVAELTATAAAAPRKKNPWRTYGIFKNDPQFDRVVRTGKRYRQRQTFEKEIARSQVLLF